ncbi:hypothetical protein [Bacteroides fragilis]|uniref:hypothetical protein n=1 Tax=Bacteroides fragilis TaxID=817 RepID=UPI000516EC37|nr:hypothetical protein [Bacteroides fragilis]MCS2355945.1 hypothetical protein [Bacteroides fragilis]
MMGEGKEERKRDTLLYYIGEIYRGEGKEDWMRKGGERDISGRKRDVSRKKIAEGIGIWREIN